MQLSKQQVTWLASIGFIRAIVVEIVGGFVSNK
jgi:hypothetical protein